MSRTQHRTKCPPRLNPSTTAVRNQVRALLQQAVPSTFGSTGSTMPTPETSGPDSPGATQRTPRLGHYLQTLGLISQEQLDHALAEQVWATNAGVPVALGDLLVAQGILTPRDLVMALMLQQLDRMQEATLPTTMRLGDLLVQAGVITAAQLASALNTQTERRQQGERILLGQILVAQGVVSPERLASVLRDQAEARDLTENHPEGTQPRIENPPRN